MNTTEVFSSFHHEQQENSSIIWWPFPFDISMEILSYCSLESILLGLLPLNKYMNDLVLNHTEDLWKKHLDRLAITEKIKYKNRDFERVDDNTELKSQVLLRILRQQFIYMKKKQLKQIIGDNSNNLERLIICEKYAKKSNILSGFIASNFVRISRGSLEELDIDRYEFMYDINPFFYMKCRKEYPIGFLFIFCFKSKQVKNVKSKSFTLTKWKSVQDKIKPDTIQNMKHFLRRFYVTSANASISTALIHYYQLPYKKLNGEYLTAHEYFQQLNNHQLPSEDHLKQFLTSQSYHFLPEYSEKFKLIVTSKKTISYSTN